ncbi:MAG: hypothetical protein WAT58_04955 [Candidatus Dormiibacterota bacterium]
MRRMQFVGVDWSGNAKQARKYTWTGVVRDGELADLSSGRDREELAAHLANLAAADEHTVIGIDFAFSMPSWFLAERGLSSAHELWDLAAAEGEEWLASCLPPFWGRVGTHPPEPEKRFRRDEPTIPRVAGIGPKSVFQVAGAGAVGTGTIRGLPLLGRLSRAGFSIWPFDPPGWPRIVEIYPRLLTGPVTKSHRVARLAFLDHDRWSMHSSLRELAADSEDAFDAGISALVMAEQQDALEQLPEARDEVERLEGRIWYP